MMLDHLAYIQNRPYRREVHARIRRLLARRPVFGRLTVVHEASYRCCETEPWPTTSARLVQALNLDGQRTLGVVLALPTSAHAQPEGDAA